VIVAHLDLDAFFAAVEELEDPSLRSKPLVVGGDPKGRGVVATANYAARTFGIQSAMSCAEALRRCPYTVFVPPRHSLYRQYSQAVWKAVRDVVPTVERTGLDEGYLDVGEVARDFVSAAPRSQRGESHIAVREARSAHDSFLAARGVAVAVQAAVRGSTSLTCSLGVASCKVVAKVASDARKPGGVTVVPTGREAAYLAPFAVRKLPGVGPKAEVRLARAGIETIGRLAALDDEGLTRLLPGKVGAMLRDRARGVDPRPLDLAVERVSIGHEETFERDVGERVVLHAELRRMAKSVATHLTGRGESARTVTTKVRYPDFSIRSRSTTLTAGIDDAETIGDLACALLDRALRDRPGPLRLVGVSVSNLEPFRQLALHGGNGRFPP
jgi:DNA polymerase-4